MSSRSRGFKTAAGKNLPEARIGRKFAGVVYLGRTFAGNHVATWPKKRGKPSSPTTKDQNSDFKRFVRAVMDTMPEDQIGARVLAHGTSDAWRDVVSRMIGGTLIEIENVEAIDVKTFLDQLGTTPGSIIVCTVDGWSIFLPPTADKVLAYNIATQQPVWVDQASGGITELTGDVIVGPGSGSQAAALAATGVTAGSYHHASVTLDAKGRISLAANGAVATAGAVGLVKPDGSTITIASDGTISGSSSTAMVDTGAHDVLAAYRPFDVATYASKAYLCYVAVSAVTGTAQIFVVAFNGDFTYTNANKTAAAKTTNTTWEVAKANGDLLSKSYFEASVDLAHNTGGTNWDSWGIGLVNENFTSQATQFAGADATGNGVMFDCGNSLTDLWYQGNKFAGYGGTCFQPGDRIGLAIDKANSRLWVRDITRDGGTPHWWGGSNTGADDPTIPSTGFAITVLAAGSHVRPAFSGYGGSTVAVRSTIYTEAVDYIGAIPAGYHDATATGGGNPTPDTDPSHWVG